MFPKFTLSNQGITEYSPILYLKWYCIEIDLAQNIKQISAVSLHQEKCCESSFKILHKEIQLTRRKALINSICLALSKYSISWKRWKLHYSPIKVWLKHLIRSLSSITVSPSAHHALRLECIMLFIISIVAKCHFEGTR